MVPDFDLQLQVAMKALAETVAPAVDPTNSVAKEQLNLAIGTLGIVRSRLPYVRAFVRRQSQDAIAIAEKIASIVGASAAGSIGGAVEKMQQTLRDPEADVFAIENARSELVSASCAAIEAAPASPQLQALILNDTEASVNRLRAWYIGSGFDPDPKSLKPLEEMLR